MKVRRARDEDVPSLVQLVNVAFLAEAPFLSGDRADAAEIRERLSRGLVLIVEDGQGPLLGCVFLEADREPGSFGLLSVRPDAQGSGLGRRLVALAEAHLLAAGRQKVQISVVSERHELFPFYRSLGYVAVGTAPFPRPEIVKKPCHFVLMQRTLSRDEVRISRGRHRGFVLETRLLLPRPHSEVFAFFADARNLDAITPPWLHFRIHTPLPLAMGEGAPLEYRLHLHGVPIPWLSAITTWDPPRRFVDEQRRGPFNSWRHEHVFVETDEGTLVCDRVEYAVPGGTLVHSLLVSRALVRVFRFRQERLRSLLS